MPVPRRIAPRRAGDPACLVADSTRIQATLGWRPTYTDIDAIVGHCRAHLADFKVPQYIALREDPLPRNPGGKVLKAQLREETDWGEPLRK